MYGSRIIISDKVNKNCAFTGSIRYDESLEDVIDKICFSLNLRKKIQITRLLFTTNIY